jgi:hypothetical protein
MKDREKELLRFAVEGLRTCGEADKRLIWTERLIKYIPLLIAEIESLDVENQKQGETALSIENKWLKQQLQRLRENIKKIVNNLESFTHQYKRWDGTEYDYPHDNIDNFIKELYKALAETKGE